MELYERRNFLSVLVDIFFDVHLWAPILCIVLFMTGHVIKKQREADAWNKVESFAVEVYNERPSLVNLNALSTKDFTVKSAEYLLDEGIHLWVKADAWAFMGDFVNGSNGFSAKDSALWEFSGERNFTFDMALVLIGWFGIATWLTYELHKYLFQ